MYLFIHYLIIWVQMQVWGLSVLCSAVRLHGMDKKDCDRILHTQLLPALQHPNIQAYRVCWTSEYLCLFKPQLAVSDNTSGHTASTTAAQLLDCGPFEVRGPYIPNLIILSDPAGSALAIPWSTGHSYTTAAGFAKLSRVITIYLQSTFSQKHTDFSKIWDPPQRFRL
jgi:hypothetical protein